MPLLALLVTSILGLTKPPGRGFAPLLLPMLTRTPACLTAATITRTGMPACPVAKWTSLTAPRLTTAWRARSTRHGLATPRLEMPPKALPLAPARPGAFSTPRATAGCLALPSLTTRSISMLVTSASRTKPAVELRRANILPPRTLLPPAQIPWARAALVAAPEIARAAAGTSALAWMPAPGTSVVVTATTLPFLAPAKTPVRPGTATCATPMRRVT
mmetsp:Transcript_25816/g.53692  ORF Transcript_25816/g.53692 Transcript_25816/m.53692 type:complete len:217 (-) Transcript_25816:479-1129(-)